MPVTGQVLIYIADKSYERDENLNGMLEWYGGGDAGILVDDLMTVE